MAQTTRIQQKYSVETQSAKLKEALSNEDLSSCRLSQDETPARDEKQILHVRLASPRGFCAGVERAVRTVEDALKTYGPPVYIRHEIVHNTHVIKRLEAMGAIFTDDIDRVPQNRPLILSAHGSPEAIFSHARTAKLKLIDATCPLVTKVHTQARKLATMGYHILLIGHAGHQEVIGTMGQAESGQMSLVETVEDARTLDVPDCPLAYISQTTLSVDETNDIIEALTLRFPDILGPAKTDICYATTNRQAAIKAIASDSDMVVVIGSATSSNSKRMVEVALNCGARAAVLTDGASSFDWQRLKGLKKLGLSSGASVPDDLIEEFLAKLASHFSIVVDTIEIARESISFKMPSIAAKGST